MTTKSCTQCGAENPEASLYCEECGTLLQAVPEPQVAAGRTGAAAPAPRKVRRIRSPARPAVRTPAGPNGVPWPEAGGEGEGEARAGEAGAQAPPRCPSCGATLFSGDAHCPQCGEAVVSPEDEAAGEGPSAGGCLQFLINLLEMWSLWQQHR